MSEQPLVPNAEIPWEPVDAAINRAARVTRSYPVDDRQDFSEEVAGRARLKAVKMLGTVPDLASAPAYAAAIVRSTAKDLYDEETRRKRGRTSLDDDRTVPFALPASGPSPEEALVRAEVGATVRRAIARLSRTRPRLARVFLMRYHEGLSALEVAAIERIKPGNVDQLAWRARAELRRLLAPLAPPAGRRAGRCPRRSRRARTALFGLGRGRRSPGIVAHGR